MNCWSNWLSCSDAAGAFGGVAARRAWNSLIAGFGEVSLDWNRVVLIDCVTLENADVDVSPSLCREPGTATTKNSATSAAMVHIAFFDSRSGSFMSSGSSGWRSASDTALSSWESNDAAANGVSGLA